MGIVKWARMTLLAAMVIVLLAACSQGKNGQAAETDTNTATAQSSPSADSVGKEEVKLRYMIWDQNQAPAYQTAIDLFQKENPEIKVDLQVVPWGSYWEKILTEIAGGSAPDVFWAYAPRLQDFIAKDAILDLTDRIKQDNVDLSKFNSTLIESFQSEGKQYGIPKDWDAIGIYYNKELLQKAGYDSYPNDLSWNPQDGGTFVKFLQDLTLDKNGKHPYDAAFDPKNIMQYGLAYIDSTIEPADVQSYVSSNGGTIIKDNEFQVDDKLKGSMQFVYDLAYKYHVAPSFTDIKIGGPETKFLSSQVALWQTGSFRLKSIKEKSPFDFGIAELPAGPEGSVVRVNGLSDHIYSKSKHPDEAWKLVKYITGTVTQDILGDTGTTFPANQDSIPKYVDFYKQQGVDVSPFVNEYKGKTAPSTTSQNYNEWREIWLKYMSLSLSGEMDVQEALNKIKQEGVAVGIK